jgi:hypothetical protein
MAKLKTGDFVFSGQALNKPLSNMAMEMTLRRMKIEDATVHGFRSSARILSSASKRGRICTACQGVSARL